MCRNIKPLFNFEPPVNHDEVRAASIQFVRKISGANKPSKMNEAAFESAVDDIAVTVQKLLDTLVTCAAPKNRNLETLKAMNRVAYRFNK